MIPEEFHFKEGDKVAIRFLGRDFDGEVTMASPNGKSLIVSSESIIDGFVGSCPVLWIDEDGGFKSLVGTAAMEISRRIE